MMHGLIALVMSFGFMCHGHAPVERPHCRVINVSVGVALGSTVTTTTTKCGKRVIVTERIEPTPGAGS